MVKVKLADILQKENQRKAANATKFIPQDDGVPVKVLVYDEDPEELPVGSEGQYITYQFKVRVQGEKNDKTWGIFGNQVPDLVEALKVHPDRVISVMKPKGGKRLIIS